MAPVAEPECRHRAHPRGIEPFPTVGGSSPIRSASRRSTTSRLSHVATAPSIRSVKSSAQDPIRARWSCRYPVVVPGDDPRGLGRRSSAG